MQAICTQFSHANTKCTRFVVSKYKKAKWRLLVRLTNPAQANSIHSNSSSGVLIWNKAKISLAQVA